jgi:hypothetical protein
MEAFLLLILYSAAQRYFAAKAKAYCRPEDVAVDNYFNTVDNILGILILIGITLFVIYYFFIR